MLEQKEKQADEMNRAERELYTLKAQMAVT